MFHDGLFPTRSTTFVLWHSFLELDCIWETKIHKSLELAPFFAIWWYLLWLDVHLPIDLRGESFAYISATLRISEMQREWACWVVTMELSQSNKKSFIPSNSLQICSNIPCHYAEVCLFGFPFALPQAARMSLKTMAWAALQHQHQGIFSLKVPQPRLFTDSYRWKRLLDWGVYVVLHFGTVIGWWCRFKSSGPLCKSPCHCWRPPPNAEW